MSTRPQRKDTDPYLQARLRPISNLAPVASNSGMKRKIDENISKPPRVTDFDHSIHEFDDQSGSSFSRPEDYPIKRDNARRREFDVRVSNIEVLNEKITNLLDLVKKDRRTEEKSKNGKITEFKKRGLDDMDNSKSFILERDKQNQLRRKEQKEEAVCGRMRAASLLNVSPGRTDVSLGRTDVSPGAENNEQMENKVARTWERQQDRSQQKGASNRSIEERYLADKFMKDRIQDIYSHERTKDKYAQNKPTLEPRFEDKSNPLSQERYTHDTEPSYSKYSAERAYPDHRNTEQKTQQPISKFKDDYRPKQTGKLRNLNVEDKVSQKKDEMVGNEGRFEKDRFEKDRFEKDRSMNDRSMNDRSMNDRSVKDRSVKDRSEKMQRAREYLLMNEQKQYRAPQGRMNPNLIDQQILKIKSKIQQSEIQNEKIKRKFNEISEGNKPVGEARFEIKVFPVECGKNSVIKLVTKLNQQVQLDNHLRAAREAFEACPEQSKWDQLRRELTKRGLTVGESDLQEAMKISADEHNPFHTEKNKSMRLTEIADCFASAEMFWGEQVSQCVDMMKLAQEGFQIQDIDLNRKGFLNIQDLVCFINLYSGSFYRNRDLSTLFKRFLRLQRSKAAGVSYQAFLNKIGK